MPRVVVGCLAQKWEARYHKLVERAWVLFNRIGTAHFWVKHLPEYHANKYISPPLLHKTQKRALPWTNQF